MGSEINGALAVGGSGLRRARLPKRRLHRATAEGAQIAIVDEGATDPVAVALVDYRLLTRSAAEQSGEEGVIRCNVEAERCDEHRAVRHVRVVALDVRLALDGDTKGGLLEEGDLLGGRDVVAHVVLVHELLEPEGGPGVSRELIGEVIGGMLEVVSRVVIVVVIRVPNSTLSCALSGR